MLEAKSLSCVRDERILFSELSFSVQPGDIIQVEGPNGAGKTSLLRILAGWRGRTAARCAGAGAARCAIVRVTSKICCLSAISPASKPY